jgi:hypothetical protein
MLISSNALDNIECHQTLVTLPVLKVQGYYFSFVRLPLSY